MQTRGAMTPKARIARAASSKAAARPRHSTAELQNALSDASGLTPKDVKVLLHALREVVAKGLRYEKMFHLHGIALLRLRERAARPAGSKNMFGREVALAAKAASQKITCVAAKPLCAAVEAVET